jgi:hypothetical protein
MSAEYPFASSTNISVYQSDELPLFVEYDWNFETNSFKFTANGNRIKVTGDEALKVWVYKALMTERNQYLAYSTRYGIQLKPFIGKVMSVSERYSELKRVIIECLMVNPYIKSIDNIAFSEDGDKVDCSVELTTIYGGLNINV